MILWHELCWYFDSTSKTHGAMLLVARSAGALAATLQVDQSQTYILCQHEVTSPMVQFKRCPSRSVVDLHKFHMPQLVMDFSSQGHARRPWAACETRKDKPAQQGQMQLVLYILLVLQHCLNAPGRQELLQGCCWPWLSHLILYLAAYCLLLSN